MPTGYDAIGVQRLSLATSAERVCAEIMRKHRLEGDGDSA
jgi:hypothetical protein